MPTLDPWNDLTGKVVLVTGASSGIGREFCLDLSKAGCKIVAAARRTDRLQSLCDDINRSNQTGEVQAVPVVLDISGSGASIEASIKKAWEAFGRINTLINNAGIRGRVHTPLDLLEAEWENLIRTNLTGSWLVSKYVCMRMRDANLRGSIINISSVGGLNRIQFIGGLAYNASKSAVNTTTEVMANELGPYGIRVNSICPGLFKSEITEGLVKKHWVKNVAYRSVPLRTYGTTDPAMTSLARYLIHDSSEYVSGNIFIADRFRVNLTRCPDFLFSLNGFRLRIMGERESGLLAW